MKEYGRVLGIDLGTKSMGVAISDPTKTIAKALDNFKHNDNHDLCIKHINYLIDKFKDITRILIGNPMHINNSESQMSKKVKEFKNKLLTHIQDKNIIVELYDERYSTKIAINQLRIKGFEGNNLIKKNKDSESALVLVEEFINKING